MVLWIGASMVLSGDLSLGQLIAFRIISGYVTQPLLRLSTIWQNIQDCGSALNAWLMSSTRRRNPTRSTSPR